MNPHKAIIILLGLIIIGCALYAQNAVILLIGIALFLAGLLLRPETVKRLCVALMKEHLKVDIEKEIAEDLSRQLKQRFPTIPEEKIKEIKSIDQIGLLATTTASTIYVESRNLCPFCGSTNVEKISGTHQMAPPQEGQNILMLHCKDCDKRYADTGWWQANDDRR